MKIAQTQVAFQPVTITLESKEEVAAVASALAPAVSFYVIAQAESTYGVHVHEAVYSEAVIRTWKALDNIARK